MNHYLYSCKFYTTVSLLLRKEFHRLAIPTSTSLENRFFFFVNFRKRKFAKLKTYPPLFVCSLHQMRLAFARDSHQAEVYAISANCRMHIHKNPRTDPRRRSCSLLSSYLFNIVKKTTSIFLKLFHSPPSFQFRKLYQSLCIPSLNSLVSRYRSLWHR